MSALMLVTNPIKRKAKKMATKKRRSSAQVAATRKLVAFNKSRRRVTKSVKRRVKRAGSTALATVRRARRSVSGAVRRHRRSSAVAHRGGMGIMNLLKSSATGAIGAVVIDIAYAKLPIPAQFKTGNMAPIVKAGVTVGLGMLAGKFLNKQLAHNATIGALTVQLRDLAHNFLPASLQGYTDINGVEYYNPAEGMSAYLSGGDESQMNEYVGGYQESEAAYSY